MKPDHYLFGYGVEAFMHYSIDFFPLAGGEERGAHNVYVQLFFDIGAVGLFTFIWLYACLTLSLAKFYKANKLMIFSIIMLIGQYAMTAYSDNMLSYLAYNWYFWFVLGATYSIAYHESRRTVNQAVKT
jgi:O-antigen ligase